ncbi:MAG: EamA family transporter [Eubacteriales bacterium]|nr:EamA family transporter [Eubacteriales bacterium]
MERKNHLAVLQILVAACGWGIIGVFSRPMAASGLSSVQITFIRSLIVVVGMGLFLLITDRSLLKINLKDLWIFLGNGLVSIVFFNICYFTTIQHATLAAASMLLYTAPCFVLLMSAAFFHERITVQKIAALVLAFVGCGLVSGFTAGDITVFALMTGIGSGAGYAAYSIFGKIALKKYKTFTIIFYTFVVAVIGLFPFVSPIEMAQTMSHSRSALINGLGLGLVSTFMPYIFYTAGLKYVDAGKASVLAFAEPMVATIAGILIFKEALKVKNMLGIALIFLAIVLLNIPIKKNVK